MAQFIYRGVTSKRLYRWMTGAIPASFVDAYGNALTVVPAYTPPGLPTEKVIMVNHDGSIRVGTSGPSALPDTYAPGHLFSDWEQA